MSDLSPETIQEILKISRPEIHDIEDMLGVKARYSTKQLFQVKAEPPKSPDTVKVQTLAGFADLVMANLENADFTGDCLIHVEDFATVTLKTRTSDDYGRRLVLVEAEPVPFKSFAFGQWHDQEAFAIAVASLFADGGDKDYVLKAASTLTNDAASTSEDDGFSQRVTVKAGLRTKENVVLKPRVDLAPFRTFPELQQPVSQFVLRARITEQGPTLMLVEADGGRWKVEAMTTLRNAMAAFNLNIPIIA